MVSGFKILKLTTGSKQRPYKICTKIYVLKLQER